jgi:transposase InsO family protein
MSSYYYCPKRNPMDRAREEADLKGVIEAIHYDFPAYGYRRIGEHILLSTGEVINSKKIRRIMTKYGLRPVWKKSFKIATTDSRHQEPIYPNLIQGMGVNGVNQVWVADITYIRIQTCFIFLAVIMDVYSRKIVGWAISKSLKADICVRALKTALAQRRPPKGCIHHSDRGIQYACDAYVGLLKENEFHISMSRKGNPYDNAFAESLMKTLKYEEIHLKEYETVTDVIENLPRFMEDVYNKKRLHSSLGYVPPDEFERRILTMHPDERPILNL